MNATEHRCDLDDGIGDGCRIVEVDGQGEGINLRHLAHEQREPFEHRKRRERAKIALPHKC